MLAEQFKSIKEKDVATQLKDIAVRLNGNYKLTFDYRDKAFYYLCYDFNSKFIMLLSANNSLKVQGVVYCIDENFKKIAIAEIGEERLTNYLKEI